jgi:hypothetical protein
MCTRIPRWNCQVQRILLFGLVHAADLGDHVIGDGNGLLSVAHYSCHSRGPLNRRWPHLFQGNTAKRQSVKKGRVLRTPEWAGSVCKAGK